jgi:hypothetical protein
MTCGGLGGVSEDWIRCYGVSVLRALLYLCLMTYAGWKWSIHILGWGLKEMG